MELKRCTGRGKSVRVRLTDAAKPDVDATAIRPVSVDDEQAPILFVV
jgi:hypothetical protein